MTILSTIVPAGIAPAAVANLLEAAARIHAPRSVAFLAGEDPITLFGAVLVAAFGHDHWPAEAHDATDLVRAAEVALKRHLGAVDLAAWSTDHTPDEQRAVLAACADKQRTEVA